MKMSFEAQIVADISNDDNFDEPTYKHLQKLLESGECQIEFVMPWNDKPTLIIVEKK